MLTAQQEADFHALTTRLREWVIDFHAIASTLPVEECEHVPAVLISFQHGSEIMALTAGDPERAAPGLFQCLENPELDSEASVRKLSLTHEASGGTISFPQGPLSNLVVLDASQVQEMQQQLAQDEEGAPRETDEMSVPEKKQTNPEQ